MPKVHTYMKFVHTRSKIFLLNPNSKWHLWCWEHLCQIQISDTYDKHPHNDNINALPKQTSHKRPFFCWRTLSLNAIEKKFQSAAVKVVWCFAEPWAAGIVLEHCSMSAGHQGAIPWGSPREWIWLWKPMQRWQRKLRRPRKHWNIFHSRKSKYLPWKL